MKGLTYFWLLRTFSIGAFVDGCAVVTVEACCIERLACWEDGGF